MGIVMSKVPTKGANGRGLEGKEKKAKIIHSGKLRF
jgi:hypothetical protein